MNRQVSCVCGRVYFFDLSKSNYKRCKKCNHRLAYLDHWIGLDVGGNIVGEPICTGNHGTVFYIKNNPQNVIKIISESIRAHARVPVLTELQTKQIKHPNMLYPLDFGLYNDFLWYTVPHCDGIKVNKTSANNWSIPDKEKCFLIERLVEVPILLEKNGLIHRDMQESNVIFTNNSLVVIDIDSINFESVAYVDSRVLKEKKRHYFYRLTWMLILMFSGQSFKEVTKLRKSKDDKRIRSFLSEQRFDKIRSFISHSYNEELCKIQSFKEYKRGIINLRERL